MMLHRTNRTYGRKWTARPEDTFGNPFKYILNSVRRKKTWHLRKRAGKYVISGCQYIDYAEYKDKIFPWGESVFQYERNNIGNYEIMIIVIDGGMLGFQERFKFRTSCKRRIKELVKEYKVKKGRQNEKNQ